jgi:hypothetical protein
VEITAIGIGLAKNVFQVHGVDRYGKAVLRKQLRRAGRMIQFASVPRLTAMFERASTSSIRYSGVPLTHLPAVTAAIIEALA